MEIIDSLIGAKKREEREIKLGENVSIGEKEKKPILDFPEKGSRYSSRGS